MSTEPSRKREGDNSNEDPPSKVPVVDPSVAPHDVVLIVKGQKFYCLKEKLAENSTFFEKMFFAEFSEKDKKEVEIGVVAPDVFQLFIDSVNGINSITDEYSEVALVAAMFLESTSFEDRILKHFAENSEITLKEQFKMAEDHKSRKLMIQVCATIKDAYELDEVVPKDLDSFCNTTKNLVMQRSFELLGIRKPSAPPLPEDPDQAFELKMNQMIDQIDVQNHHGEVLRVQAELLRSHTAIELTKMIVANIIRDDPLIKELTTQLQDVHEQSERNFVEGQIQVLKWKNIYSKLPETTLSEFDLDQLRRRIIARLVTLSAILNRYERFQSRSYKVTLGNRKIDEIYRRITAEAVGNINANPPRNTDDLAVWLQKIATLNRSLKRYSTHERYLTPRSRPDNLRDVSKQASFRLINEFVSDIRDVYYTSLREHPPEHNGAGDINQEMRALDPREQDQQGN